MAAKTGGDPLPYHTVANLLTLLHVSFAYPQSSTGTGSNIPEPSDGCTRLTEAWGEAEFPANMSAQLDKCWSSGYDDIDADCCASPRRGGLLIR